MAVVSWSVPVRLSELPDVLAFLVKRRRDAGYNDEPIVAEATCGRASSVITMLPSDLLSSPKKALEVARMAEGTLLGQVGSHGTTPRQPWRSWHSTEDAGTNPPKPVSPKSKGEEP